MQGEDSEADEDASEALTSSNKTGQKCVMVWQGISDKRAFKEFLKVPAFTEVIESTYQLY